MTESFNANSTADQVLDGFDLSDKIILITGASGGIGKETARALACKGARIILAARDQNKNLATSEELRHSTGNPHIDTLQIELASQQSIHTAAKEFLARYDTLHCLINNAGVMACPQMHTDEGIELQFGVCHIGHFLLSCLLTPALLKGAPARVITLSSGGHRIAPVDFDDINFEQRDYNNWVAYGQAKSANVLFSVELNKRLQSRGVHAFAVHPGTIFGTDLARHLSDADLKALAKTMPLDMAFKTVEQGAATSVWAATSPSLSDRGGLYLEDCQIGSANDNPAVHSGYRSWAVDPDFAARLWQLSEQRVGESFL